MFQVRSIPTLVFMREKIVVFSNPGAIPGSALEEGVGQLLDLDMEQVRKDLAEAQSQQNA
jgi:thioredoxin 1